MWAAEAVDEAKTCTKCGKEGRARMRFAKEGHEAVCCVDCIVSALGMRWCDVQPEPDYPSGRKSVECGEPEQGSATLTPTEVWAVPCACQKRVHTVSFSDEECDPPPQTISEADLLLLVTRVGDEFVWSEAAQRSIERVALDVLDKVTTEHIPSPIIPADLVRELVGLLPHTMRHEPGCERCQAASDALDKVHESLGEAELGEEELCEDR